jgi:hypothetical protein
MYFLAQSTFVLWLAQPYGKRRKNTMPTLLSIRFENFDVLLCKTTEEFIRSLFAVDVYNH